MIIFPAIDLRHGRCVRLRQGDPDAETVFGEDPVAMAQHWVAQGAEWLHVVNLDGALGATDAQRRLLHRPTNILVQTPGQDRPLTPHEQLMASLPVNLRVLYAIAQAVDVPIQFGGGLRTMEDIRLALELGAERVVIGTAAIDNASLVEQALLEWGPQRIVIGIDAKDGKVATHGWQQVSNVDAVDLGHRMQAMGVQYVVYTDISRDGMLTGVNAEMTARLGDITGLHVIASGGVAGIQDIERLKRFEQYNIEGVITGQAIYTGALDLRQGIALGKRPLARRSAGLVPYRHTPHGPEYLLLYNLFFEQWQFPRGGVETGELDLETARREFSEETGLPIIQVHESCRTVLDYIAVIRDYEIHRTVVYYLAEIGAGELSFGDENHCEARWEPYETAWELLTETSPEQLPALDAAQGFLREA